MMERLHKQYDKEYMKLAMLKHEETFREQVYELHRLYRIQKMLMKDIARNPHYRISNPNPGNNESCRVDSENEYDHGDLELTLGPKSYYQKKMKVAEPESSGPGFSWSSSSTGSSHMLKETPVSTQDRLNTPPWLFQALSLNMT